MAWDALFSWTYERRVTLALTLLGMAFFGALTIYSFWRPNKRDYRPGLLLIDLGVLNSLVRNLFFFHLSPHPARPGGMWRLLTGAILVRGTVLFFRACQKEHSHTRGDSG